MKTSLALVAFVAFVASIASSKAYKITNASALQCRSGPGTNYAVERTLHPPIDINIVCQTPGTVVSGHILWDKTQFSCYVADFYVQTGTSGYVAPRCRDSRRGPCSGINKAGTDLIKEFEGFVARPAPDPIGLPTVGYGHLLSQSSGFSEVPFSFPLSPATATELLQRDIPRYTAGLASSLNDRVTLNQNQWAALTSWTFNMGCEAVRTSSLIRRLNQGQDPNTVAAQELPCWNKAGGRVMPGLVHRRDAEVALFRTPSSEQAYPHCTRVDTTSTFRPAFPTPQGFFFFFFCGLKGFYFLGLKPKGFFF